VWLFDWQASPADKRLAIERAEIIQVLSPPYSTVLPSPPILFPPKLARVQILLQPTIRAQLLANTVADNYALLEHHQLVGVLDRAQLVSDQEAGAASK
jgi:hypothetical protein